MSNDKGTHKNNFSEWKGHVLSPIDEIIHTLLNEITSGSVKSIFCGHEIKSNMLSHNEYFVIVPIDKAANDVNISMPYLL